MTGILRAIKTSIVNFGRNIWLATAATLVMVVTLTILTVILLVVNIGNVTIRSVQQRVDISVYFNAQTSDDQVKAIEADVQSFPEVTSVTYTSSTDALAAFKSKHANDALIQQSLQELGTNPLPATLQVKAKNLSQYPAIAQELSAARYQPYISSVNYDDNRAIIDRLSKVISDVKKVGIGLAALFSFIAVLVIFNTIRLTIYNRREEVEIMKLVGATNWYIRWPFIIESILYALIATAITIGLMVPVFRYVIPQVQAYLGVSGAGTGSITYFKVWQLYLIQLGVALFLGMVSSYIAIRRYLRV
jgi:cell division transport system permease protein